MFGGGVADPAGQVNDHPADNISKANSVMNRLLKLVQYLATVAPASGLGSFQQQSSRELRGVQRHLRRVRPGVARRGDHGHSQGPGVALYLGKFFPLSKVALLSGSYDAFELADGSYVVAPWITEGGLAVANADIGTFIHTSDYAQDRFRAVADRRSSTGPEVSVQSAAPPYGGSRRLLTSLEPTCPFDGAPNHDSTGVDVCVPNGASTRSGGTSPVRERSPDCSTGGAAGCQPDAILSAETRARRGRKRRERLR